MKGHIRERSPGHWAIVIDAPSSGGRKRKWHSFKGTKREAQRECARLITEIGRGELCRKIQNGGGRVCEGPDQPVGGQRRHYGPISRALSGPS